MVSKLYTSYWDLKDQIDHILEVISERFRCYDMAKHLLLYSFATVMTMEVCLSVPISLMLINMQKFELLGKQSQTVFDDGKGYF